MKILFIIVSFFIFLTTSAQEKMTKSSFVKKISVKELRTIMDTTSGPLIVNFWASWCGPCVREIPWFEKGIEKLDVPVKLLLVSLDFNESYPKQLNAFVTKNQYKSEVVFLNETDADYFIPMIDAKWTGAIPASIFINNNKNYYRLFNQQMPEVKFDLEVKLLIE